MAEVLVMCSQCGRPQLAAKKTCAGCGAQLPQTPEMPQLPSPRDKLLDAFQPFLELSLGGGRRLLLSDRRLEWYPPSGKGLSFELGNVRQVRFRQRPAFEALLFAGAFAVGAAMVPWLFVQLVFGGLAGVAAIACLTQKHYALVVHAGGGRRTLLLGIGAASSPIAQRALSVWESLRLELERLRVTCEPSTPEKGKQ
ncbi:MAG: hypothetical protein ACOZIN_02125 [Myxococcota bacterium]